MVSDHSLKSFVQREHLEFSLLDAYLLLLLRFLLNVLGHYLLEASELRVVAIFQQVVYDTVLKDECRLMHTLAQNDVVVPIIDVLEVTAARNVIQRTHTPDLLCFGFALFTHKFACEFGTLLCDLYELIKR